MEIDKKSRKQLKEFFVKNAIPTESNFGDLIEAGFNQKDDGIAKPDRSPLCIEASGDTQKVINFYPNFEDPTPSWSLALNPRSKAADPASARAGFAITDGSGAARLFIDGAGNVGIGTQTPDRPLSLARSGDSTEIAVNDSLFIDGQGGTVRVTNNALVSNGQWALKDAAQRAFTLEIRNSGMLELYGTVTPGKTDFRKMATFDAPNNRVSFPSGNVGVGTAEPGAVLDIKANSGTWGGWLEAIRFSRPEHSAITHPGGGLLFGLHGNRNFYFADTKGGKYVLTLNADSGNMTVAGGVYAGNSDIYFTKTSHDHTAVGNTPGHAAIENARSHNCLMILGRSTGNPVPRRIGMWDFVQVHGTFVNSSDARQKRDVTDLGYGLKEITELRPVSFNWKAMGNPHKSMGLLAQEVLPVLGEAVYSDENGQDDNLSIAYTSLIPVLINAVKELDAKVEQLSGEVAAKAS